MHHLGEGRAHMVSLDVLVCATMSAAATAGTAPLHGTERSELPMPLQSTTPLCACGCGQSLTPKVGHGQGPKRYLKGHNSQRRWPEERVCACGCGRTFLARDRAGRLPVTYIHGHHNRRLRKLQVRVLTAPRRRALYEAAAYSCQDCGMTAMEQRARFGRDLEIHHENHDHFDNREGNHRVLCTVCHNRRSLSIRDEEKKKATWRRRFEDGLIVPWSRGETKETHPGLAKMAATKRRR